MSNDKITADVLRLNGNHQNSIHEGAVNLYYYDDTEYVVLPDNSVITREEDNSDGAENAYFPYPED